MNEDYIKSLQQKAALIAGSKESITKTTSLPAIYSLIDNINDAVSSLYKHISCKDRCFLCCQHSNIPTATSLEWQNLYEFILNSSETFKAYLINSTNKLFSEYGSELKRVHIALEVNDSESVLKELYKVLPKFKGKSCIFLKKGSCSIYEVRPAKCRTQGYSLMQFGDSVQFQTCSPEVARLEEVLKKQGNRKVLMPVWNDYEKQIQSLQDDFAVTILPVWLYTHIKNNEFLPDVNLIPDFHKVLEKF